MYQRTLEGIEKGLGSEHEDTLNVRHALREFQASPENHDLVVEIASAACAAFISDGWHRTKETGDKT